MSLGPAALSLLAGLGLAAAQEPDLTRPPRLLEEPGTARLADQPPDRAPVLEEVIVVNESEWRLPDLGSTWRANREAERPVQRIETSFLPLFDPENQDPYANLFPPSDELRRVGFIELFRVRFGRRARE